MIVRGSIGSSLFGQNRVMLLGIFKFSVNIIQNALGGG